MRIFQNFLRQKTSEVKTLSKLSLSACAAWKLSLLKARKDSNTLSSRHWILWIFRHDSWAFSYLSKVSAGFHCHQQSPQTKVLKRWFPTTKDVTHQFRPKLMIFAEGGTLKSYRFCRSSVLVWFVLGCRYWSLVMSAKMSVSLSTLLRNSWKLVRGGHEMKILRIGNLQMLTLVNRQSPTSDWLEPCLNSTMILQEWGGPRKIQQWKNWLAIFPKEMVGTFSIWIGKCWLQIHEFMLNYVLSQHCVTRHSMFWHICGGSGHPT